MPSLYIISTPIGNLEDITLRALRVLGEVTLIAAEDTRHTRKLLQRHAIATPCISYHEHSDEGRIATILDTLADGDVALVSDAGTPGVSDPGYALVRACIAHNIAVVPIPGPSAPVAALVASGLPTDRYLFMGFLPRRSKERRAALLEVAALRATLICFEAPHRLLGCLGDVLAVLGDRRVVVARELTKLHEELVRLPVSAALAHFEAHSPRGECTLLIDGTPPVPAETSLVADDEPVEARIANRLRELRAQGIAGSAAAKRVAKEFNLSKGAVYDVWLGLDDEM
jgi:16S rRNA (cytidine1402-2'-O)-methyltransferase